MTPEYEMFRVEEGGLVWLGPAENLDEAKAQIQQQGATVPGDYIICNPSTGDRFQMMVRASQI